VRLRRAGPTKSAPSCRDLRGGSGYRIIGLPGEIYYWHFVASKLTGPVSFSSKKCLMVSWMWLRQRSDWKLHTWAFAYRYPAMVGHGRCTITSSTSVAIVACNEILGLMLLLQACDVFFSRDEGVREGWATSVETPKTPGKPSCDQLRFFSSSSQCSIFVQRVSWVRVCFHASSGC